MSESNKSKMFLEKLNLHLASNNNERVKKFLGVFLQHLDRFKLFARQDQESAVIAIRTFRKHGTFPNDWQVEKWILNKFTPEPILKKYLPLHVKAFQIIVRVDEHTTDEEFNNMLNEIRNCSVPFNSAAIPETQPHFETTQENCQVENIPEVAQLSEKEKHDKEHNEEMNSLLNSIKLTKWSPK
jgi:hypothetical protein